MKTIIRKHPSLVAEYPLEKITEKEDILFLDIETTGFTAKSSSLYLIGCVYYKENMFQTIQWFAESPVEEAEILNAFFAFSADYHYLIHFNGNHFDIPYLEQKCVEHSLSYNFEHFDGIDIYRRIAPLKNFLKLPNCKQKTIEAYLGIVRDDTFGGGELIGVYQDYVNTPTDYAFDTLVLHNLDDIQGMVKVLPILAYVDLYQDEVKVTKVNANYYRDFNNETRAEVIMKLRLPSSLPISVSNYENSCYFSGLGNEATLKVPLLNQEMKYFYSNYHDYYYLPAEDLALHKSVSSFVDKEHREPAKASNCYTRKISEYLPEWEPLFTPVFKASYESRDTFFELTDEFKKSREDFSIYANHVLHTLMSKKNA